MYRPGLSEPEAKSSAGGDGARRGPRPATRRSGPTALVAPRPLLCTEALHDEWANPWGSQQTTEAAREVYAFLGAPEQIGNHYRPGGHEHNVEDWEALLDFADFQFFGRPLPGDFYAENFDRADSLINRLSPDPASSREP